MKITNHQEPFRLEHKRLYLPSSVESACPHCGEVVTRHCGNNYLSFPYVNTSFDIHMWHETEDGDDHEWEVQVILRMSLEPVETEKS